LGTICNDKTVGKIPTPQKSNQFFMRIKMYFMSLKGNYGRQTYMQ